ncbi:MAG: class I SAM-dependent methyltransferase [Actinomycetota bacterium]|nr:class I SAM-dependent methyltransferase [Actinomycetota bacterium]
MPEPQAGPTAAELLGTSGIAWRPVSAVDTARANRRWWDADADEYLAEHLQDIGDVAFLWCPEGLTEGSAGLLGPVAGRRILEIGCGSAPCSRWLRTQGADVVGTDLSAGMLRHAVTAAKRTGVGVPLVQADACSLPLASESFDLACSSFGAVAFVADSGRLMAEVARVLRPGGRWVFSVTHPMRWVFPDDPAVDGLTVSRSYFNRTPYVEVDGEDRPTYVEHHRTMGDRIREIVSAGLALSDLLEPEWPPGRTREWGQWSPLRGGLMPGTAIYVCDKVG